MLKGSWNPGAFFLVDQLGFPKHSRGGFGKAPNLQKGRKEREKRLHISPFWCLVNAWSCVRYCYARISTTSPEIHLSYLSKLLFWYFGLFFWVKLCQNLPAIGVPPSFGKTWVGTMGCPPLIPRSSQEAHATMPGRHRRRSRDHMVKAHQIYTYRGVQDEV